MLDEYCNRLSEATQVALAIRLIEVALPVWENYVAKRPGVLKQVNDLLTKDHWVQGGAHHIADDLPRAALLELKRTLEVGKSEPITIWGFDLPAETCLEPATAAGSIGDEGVNVVMFMQIQLGEAAVIKGKECPGHEYLHIYADGKVIYRVDGEEKTL